jgi:DNA-binding IclR family transcriptional regulator
VLRKLDEFLSLFSYETAELTALEIAEWLGRPKSTVYRVFARVADEGFLDRDEATGCYRVGIFFAVLADLAPRSTSLQRLVFPVLLRLSRETQESVTLLVRHGGAWVADVWAVAAPVRNHTGAVTGAITVGGPRGRVEGGSCRR